MITVAVYAVTRAGKAVFMAHREHIAGLVEKHGASSSVDAWEARVPDGAVTSFPLAVQRQPNEVIAYSHILWPDRQTYEAGMGPLMADIAAFEREHPMPFDGKRMVIGTFEAGVDVQHRY